MFVAIVLISGFTAAITTALTVTELGTIINGPDDLLQVRLGTVAPSTSDDYLRDRRLVYQPYETASRWPGSAGKRPDRCHGV
jgi:hypothetical protein